MRTVEQLGSAANDPRLAKQPRWVQELVYDLVLQMKAGHRRAAIAAETAEKEVTEARLLLASGPADSDTYVDLPRSASVYEEDTAQRPLGKGATVEFRDPGAEPGEGLSVKWEDGALTVRGCGPLAVVPQHPCRIKIEAR